MTTCVSFHLGKNVFSLVFSFWKIFWINNVLMFSFSTRHENVIGKIDVKREIKFIWNELSEIELSAVIELDGKKYWNCRHLMVTLLPIFSDDGLALEKTFEQGESQTGKQLIKAESFLQFPSTQIANSVGNESVRRRPGISEKHFLSSRREISLIF